MSAVAKTHHIKIAFGDKHPKLYFVPNDKAQGIITLISEYRAKEEETVSSEEAFKHLDNEFTRVGAVLSGFRLRDNYTQKNLAKMLGTSQSAVAEMEKGKRSITKAMAKKLAEIFQTDYRVFL